MFCNQESFKQLELDFFFCPSANIHLMINKRAIKEYELIPE